MLHDDLLIQASALLSLDARRPRQANLRRAISTAYYAVFHAIGYQVGRQVVGLKQQDSELRTLVCRSLEHAEMKAVLTRFVQITICLHDLPK